MVKLFGVGWKHAQWELSVWNRLELNVLRQLFGCNSGYAQWQILMWEGKVFDPELAAAIPYVDCDSYSSVTALAPRKHT